jgi:hypothetical protein
VYVIKLSGLHCTENVFVTQCKGPKEELLRALLGSRVVNSTTLVDFGIGS